jgi:hypothetical protein
VIGKYLWVIKRMKKTFKILRVLIFISSVSLLVSCKFFSSSDSKSIQKTVDTAEVIKLHLAAAESLSEICTSPSMNEKMDGFFESRREAYMPPSSDGSVKTGVFYQSHISSNPGDVQGWMKNKAPEEVARELYYQDMRASLRNRLRSELILRSQEVEFHMLPFNLSGDGLRAKTPTCDIVKKTDRDGLATTILSNDRELGQVSRHLSTVNEYTWEFTAAVIAERSFEALFIEDFIIGGGWKRLGDRMGVVSFDKDIFFPFYPDSSSPMGLKNPAQVLDQIYAELPLLTWEMKEDGKIFGKETLARQIMGISAGGTRSNFGPWFTDFVIKSGKLALRIQQARQNDQIKATLEVLNIVSLTEDQMRVIGGIMQYLKTDFPQE